MFIGGIWGGGLKFSTNLGLFISKLKNGLVPQNLVDDFGYHITRSLYRTPVAHATCDWARRPSTRKHRQKSETLIESFGVVVAGALEGDTRFRGYLTLVAT